MEYRIIRSNRKTLSLEINENCEVIARAPYFMKESKIEEFVTQKRDWIEKSLVKMETRTKNKKQYSQEEIKELYKYAKEILPARLQYWSGLTNLHPSGVKITTAKKRFGSCSGKNSLCFSVFLFDYPVQAIDYVIVHELCHIKQHNHSKKFWALVEKYMPDYKERQKLLKV